LSNKGISIIAWAGRLLAVVVSLLSLAPATVIAATISVSYTATQSLPTGTIVTIDGQKNGSVVPSDNDANSNIIGVVVDRSMQKTGVGVSTIQIQVASKGEGYVLVSNINGAVKKGSPITSSPLAGIGMSANVDGRVAGIAQADLSEQSLDAQYKVVKDKKGNDNRVLVGLVPIALDVSYYQIESTSNSVPKFLRDISRAISDKPVSTIRIWASVAVMLVGILIAMVLVYGSVRSSIVAIGRNPLAKRTIQSSMLKVIGIAIIVLITSLGTVYMILKG